MVGGGQERFGARLKSLKAPSMGLPQVFCFIHFNTCLVVKKNPQEGLLAVVCKPTRVPALVPCGVQGRHSLQGKEYLVLPQACSQGVSAWKERPLVERRAHTPLVIAELVINMI